MRYLRKLHERRHPPGLELTILKRMPTAVVASVMMPFGIALGARLFPPQGTAAEIAQRTTTVDILSIATGVTLLTALMVIGFACIIVYLMKGPAYVADAYYMEDPERTGPTTTPVTDDRGDAGSAPSAAGSDPGDRSD